ncbi:MAG: restriction endonuclease subunit S [Desulfobacteraceae bacterium]|nr:restriction endonuclease subunit S [Desulfobacteraceae bacterium]
MKLDTYFNNFGLLADAPNGVQKLREMILQLAVQGKLVPQDPKDEPASVLLEHIRAEKERLIKEKKMRRGAPLPPIDTEIVPYELPMSWAWSKLGAIGRIVGGGTPKTGQSEYFSEKGISWLTPADLYKLEGKYIARGRRDISALGLQKSSAQLMPKGTVLFSSRAPIGYVAIATNDLCTNQGFKSCVPFIMAMNEYIYYFLKHTAKAIDRQASGTTFKEVSGKIVSGIMIPLPPLKEQKRIVAKVDELMALCDELEARKQQVNINCIQLNDASIHKLLKVREPKKFSKHWQRICDNFDLLYSKPENVNKLRQAILQLAVQGKLVTQDPKDEPASIVFKKIENERMRLIKEKKIRKSISFPPVESNERPYTIPKSWVWLRLNNICALITDGTHLTPKYTESGRIFLSAKNIKPFKFMPENHRYVSEEDYQGYVKTKKAEYRDVLLTRVGAGIGEAAVVDKRLDFAIYVSLALIKPVRKFLDSNFLVVWLNSPLGTQLSRKYTYGRGVSQGNLNLSLIRHFIIGIPPIDEQKRIVAKVDELMAFCDELEANLSQSQQDCDRLMEAAVTEILAA